MRCPYHPDEPSISCFRCISEADEQHISDEIVVDSERERVLSRLRDVESAVEDLRDALEIYDEALARRFEE